MTTRHLTMRVGVDMYDKLEAESKRQQRSVSAVAKTLLEEGLRMQDHPGIVFRPGPAGRRPALADGPDVWEVARVFQGNMDKSDKAVKRYCRLTGLDPHQIRTTMRYYASYQEEIEDWIRELDEEAHQAYAAWQAEQQLAR
jgi:predicted CopG family antitoxin